MATAKKKGAAKSVPPRKAAPKPPAKKPVVKVVLKAPPKAPAKPLPKAAPPSKAAPPPKALPPKGPAPKAPAAPPAKSPVPAAKAPPAKATPPAAPAPATPEPKKRGLPPPVAPAAAPVIKPALPPEGRQTVAPMPAPVRQGAVDTQLFSAINYGVFSAINKTFGTFGQSLIKNASLRILEYGYKKQWLPPKSKDPIKALNEFFGRLETMGYAERIHIGKKDDRFVCEIQNIADWDALYELRELHYPLLPVFVSEIILAFLDQYFGLIVAMEPYELVPEKRGMRVRFSIHTKAETVATTAPEKASAYSMYDLEE